MSRRITHVVVVFAAVFVAAQLVRPERANPATDPNRTIQAQMGAASGLVGVLDRACNDCHSNATVWQRYTNIAPLSWVIVHGVTEGRKAVNFSEWGAYPPDVQRILLVQSCRAASAGTMPGRPYTLLRPDARLSAQDVETICTAARQAEPHAARISQ